MQMVKNIIIAMMVSFVSFFLFMPKKAFYYKMEEALFSKGIVLNEKEIDEGVFTLSVKEIKVYAKGIHLVTIESLDIFTILFYTTVDVKSLQIDESLKAMAPQNIDIFSATHTIVSPTSISLEAEGTFKNMDGNIDIIESKVYLNFTSDKGIDMLKPKLQKDEKGWHYETSF